MTARHALQPTHYTVAITSREDLGQRAACVRKLGGRAAKQRHAAATAWVGDLAATRAKRLEILKKLAYQPPKVALSPRLLSECETPAGFRRVYQLRISPDDHTQAVLMLPHGASRSRPVPGLLALHEHGGLFAMGKEKIFAGMAHARPLVAYQQRTYGGQAPGDYFCQQGYAVLSIDQMGFGSRALWKADDPPLADFLRNVSSTKEMKIRLRMRYEQFALHRALLAHGVTEADMAIHDSLRAVDFLASLPQVDDARLGAFGLSVGAMHCHMLAALDDRIAASVRICWTGDMQTMLQADGPRGLGVHFLPPGLMGELHAPEWVALSEPRPALILAGKKDLLYPLQAQHRARRQVMRYLQREDDPKRVTWQWFEGGHAFVPAQQQIALAFFNRHLQRRESSGKGVK